MDNLLYNVNVPTKKATFAMNCFWGPDALFGALKGVVRLRVGYAGGTTEDPTYHNLGDHTEATDLDYNPQEISFQDILDLFWDNHDPSAKTTIQYTSVIYYHDAEQKEIAERSMKEKQKKYKGTPLVTQIVPYKEFYNAEDYHQKYRLQKHPILMEAVNIRRGPALLSSFLAARLNGYVVGFGGVKQFDEEVKLLGLDAKTAEYVRKLVVKHEGDGLTCH